MKLYTSDGCSYAGMTEAVVTALRADLGCTTTFVSETDYLAYLDAHKTH